MSTTIVHGIAFRARTKEGGKGFFARLLDAMVRARSLQAKRYVNSYLLTLDDKTLEAAGFNRAELEREGSLPYAF